MMVIRYRNLLPLFDKWLVDDELIAWVGKQKRSDRDKFGEIKRIIRDEAVIKGVGAVIAVMEPVMKLLRLTDGKTGATLGKVYAYMLQLDELFRGDDETLKAAFDDEDGLGKMHALFMARWEYFHTPLFAASYRFDPEFVRRRFSATENSEVKKVLKQLSTDEHSYAAMIAQLGEFEEALRAKLEDLDDDVAFSVHGRGMPPHRWASMYLAKWPALRYAVMRISSLACSASGCEHSWSVEGWIHSKKRNRLSQTNVERLLRAHTNLVLFSQWKDWEAKVLPWDIEMIPEEPEEAQLEQEPEQEPEKEPEQEAEGASAGGGGAPLPPRARAGRSRG